MAPFLRERAPRLAGATGAEVDVVHVLNRFFGESVTVAGLLGGRDMIDALGPSREGDVVVLPAESLNGDELFIDSVPLADLVTAVAPASVIRGYEVTEALGGL